MFNEVGMGKYLALKTMTVSKSSSKQNSGLFGYGTVCRPALRFRGLNRKSK
jgi:hypothetical protein